MSQTIKHQNNGSCLKCKELFNRYAGFNTKVRSWFVLFQEKHPEFHISCAGRGHADQEAAKNAKASRASYGESAHNYNAAIDTFVQLPGKGLYDEEWFSKILAPAIPYYLNWYGAKGSVFPELPHIELREWRGRKASGELSLVEPLPTGSLA